ncbi:TPA: hypothetical protein ACH3X3_003541 [Trebouxia sp. C0006]
MLTLGVAAGLRADDIGDLRWIWELTELVNAQPQPMQPIATAARGSKTNQDGHTVYHAFALHKDPLRCPVSHLIQYILFSLRVNACPIIEMITGSDLRWRSQRLLFRSPADAFSKQPYHVLAGMLLDVLHTIEDLAVKKKVTHLFRQTGTIILTAAGCTLDVLRIRGRWTGGGGTAAQVYIPKSPLSALPAVAVLSGFSTEFMRSHTSGRATVAVPPA